MISNRLNKFPPCLCRLVARKDGGRRMMSYSDIAKRAGISRSNVIKISKMDTWDAVPLRTIDRFATACGVNLLQPSRHIHFLKKRGKHLYNGRPQEKKLVLDLMFRVKTALSAKADGGSKSGRFTPV